MTTKEEPSVITLNNTNTIEILSKYVEVAQQKGAYLLSEAEVLKRSCDVLINNIVDNEININMAKQLLIQGAVKGQKHGAYTLNDASLLNKVVQFISNSLEKSVQSVEQTSSDELCNKPFGYSPEQSDQPTSTQVHDESLEDKDDNDDNEYDLSDLAEPIPLKPKEV